MRLTLPASLGLALCLLGPASANAQTVFNVTGVLGDGSPFSGTLTIDTTVASDSALTAASITIGAPDSATCTTINFQFRDPVVPGYVIDLFCTPPGSIELVLESDAAGDLLGYTGGPINTDFSAFDEVVLVTSGTVSSGSLYQVKYATNLSIGDSYFDIQNTAANGDPPLGPGVISGANSVTGNLCANVYTIDPNEELISCCSYLITPGQTVSLTALTDLAGASNTATGSAPSSISVKLLASLAGTGGTGNNCANSAALVAITSTTFPLAAGGLAAWGTTLHQSPGSGPFVTTETPFTPATLSTAELTSLTGRCAALVGNLNGPNQCTNSAAIVVGASKK